MPRVKSMTNADPKPTIGVYSFGSKGNVFPKVQFEFDVSKLRDPSGQKQFKGLNGVDPEVRDWVAQDTRVQGIVDNCLLLADDLVKPKKRETSDGVVATVVPVSGWLSFSFKDVHGRWAGPAVAEAVAEAFSKAGYTVATVHCGLKVPGGGTVVM